MRGQRVVITGMGAVSPYGEGVSALTEGLFRNVCALRTLPEEQRVRDVACAVAGLVPPVEARRIPRDIRRAMSPMSVFACLAAWEALEQAGFPPGRPRPRTGVAVGSTLGSPQALQDFFGEFLGTGGVDGVRSTAFFKVMGHTVAANLAVACGCEGRLLAPSAACASGLLGIGLGYEAIAAGRESLMLCGGADEFHALTAATFDRLGAASHAVDPRWASRPFDRARDGVICGEGAGILLLESLDSAMSRGAAVLAEVAGFAAVTSPMSIAHPDAASIRECMERALDDAGLRAGDIGYVNAHATGTEHGDVAEGRAVAAVWGRNVPVSSLKGHMGHTMAASGALETIACVEMLLRGACLSTLHLASPDPQCGELRHATSERPLRDAPLLKNCFALGGCNTSVVITPFHI